MGRFVDDEPVQAAGKGDVGRILHVFRTIGVGFPTCPAGGEGFRSHDVLSEDMGDGSRFADVRHRHRNRGTVPGVVHPDGGHRNVGRPFQVHAISHENVPVLMGFRIAAFQARITGDIPQAVIILRHQFTERLPPVEQEPLGIHRTVNDLPGQGKQPREQRITPPLLEFLEHVLGPGHLPGFIAVREYILNRGTFINAEEFFEIGLPGRRIKFIHFQARRLGRGRMVLLPRQGNAETVNAPASCRNLPEQSSVPPVDETEVPDGHHRIVGVRSRIFGEIVRGGKARLILGMVHFDDTMQYELGDLCPRRDPGRQTVTDQ